MELTIGVPTYSSTKKKTWRLKDGANVYRILPPFGSFAKDGKWATYESIHWGYKGSKGIRTFSCGQVKDYKSKMVKVACSECDLIEQRKKDYENQLNQSVEVEKKMTKDQAKEFLKPLSSWLYDHNLDKKWYMNAMNNDGEIGRLAIPHKMYQALQSEIDRLIKKGIDPITATKGVKFNFERTGTSNKTVHKCTAVTENVKVNGEELERTLIVPLTEEVIKRMATEAWDLKGMFKSLKADEVKQLVDSGGDADVVDRIFAYEAPPHDEDDTVPSPEELHSAVVNLAETVAPPVVSAPVTVSAVDEIAALKAKLAALEAPKAVESVKEVKVEVPATDTKPLVTPAGMSNDDFMAKFGPKK